MKIKKYPQSCLMIQTKNEKILIDPGILKYKEEYLEEWKEATILLITHKHGDHCNIPVLEELQKTIKVYSTREVQEACPSLKINIVKEGDKIVQNEVVIEVVKAIHGYQPLLKNGNMIQENVGYIIDDGKNRLYDTSDTICFPNEYRADILCIPVTGYGLTMSAFEASLYAKEVGAILTLPIHMDNPKFPPNNTFIGEMFHEAQVEYEILNNEETITID